ncbi:putative 3-OXOACYL-(ACYL-CARRIER PROTEIN) REDUCTASE-RELATED [Vibrio nigripulchritudo MADA3029]|uniref:SDR family NAD(P)-dependent oxidoreductase n=1 Tax=Vibrio nigripulchritudo TaxID=28173 RepID=UPI0003B185BB|nr:SDR family oxidoreductase [Vibrio nigripulchritudo]CCN48699.1 putative 3-OXOACYL-(ACYL-CARRIER PROTEIN) REDUCTASE-RELATED [Vibrio nigripulchritudo MADA3020]CCN52762.1 putative 3-OXOACYL-(ACYL-CARRIER PROTEIN) REDUCTASE-RELATED [Vibrio nigripulchritudo MADA3021]CCN57747.1 putative 3-OXOACYL-(ACYL-CARRIER PROTEIN) REDUCTASE-RELATED [Vibrio nigripulchritudo MADA3029]
MNSGKILITGATAGIGLATAQSLSQQGYELVITGRNPDKLASVANSLDSSKVTPILCDSESVEDVQSLGETLVGKGITLDGLVLNAGVYFPNELESTTLEAFDHTMNINFRGPFFTLQSLLSVMNPSSSIVMVSSLVVKKAFPTSSLYAASKAALEGLVGGLNLDLAGKGIRINCVRPGVTATEIQGKAGADEEAINGLKQMMASTPLGRILETSDIVPAIEYLLSPASVGMRGVTMDVDAGHAI